MNIKLLLLILLLQKNAIAQQAGNSEKWRSKLSEINNRISQSFTYKNASGIIDLYGDSGVVCMPEFHRSLYSKAKIESYYQLLFQGINFNKYKRTIYEVQQLGDHLLEIGNYESEFERDGSSYFSKGKYLNVWKIKSAGKPVLISEAWGNDAPSDRAIFSFITLPDVLVTPPDSSKEIIRQINDRNKLLSQLVADREGERHATEFFTEDAIYMTYDTSMLIGMKNIKPYFEEHEKPGAVAIDSISIQASRMIPLKDHVIEYGYYYVVASWNDHKERVAVTGKSTNIWKRQNGKWMLYRQMVNHD